MTDNNTPPDTDEPKRISVTEYYASLPVLVEAFKSMNDLMTGLIDALNNTDNPYGTLPPKPTRGRGKPQDAPNDEPGTDDETLH